MEHHGPPEWTYNIPLLPQDAHYAHVNVAILIFLFILVVSLIANAAIRKGIDQLIVPSRRPGLVTIVDLLVENIFGVVEGVIGKDTKKYFPMAASLFVFVLISNLLGLLPLGYSPSTSINTTLALGLVSYLYFNWCGIKEMGMKGYFGHFLMGLGIWGVPIAILEFVVSHLMVRPTTLGLRLMLNMNIDHLLAQSFGNIFAWLVPVPLLLFGIVVCTIQAFLFAVLTSVYVQMATEHEDHGEHGDHHHAHPEKGHH